MSIIVRCIYCGKEFETDDWFGYCLFCNQPYQWYSEKGIDDLVKHLIKDLWPNQAIGTLKALSQTPNGPFLMAPLTRS